MLFILKPPTFFIHGSDLSTAEFLSGFRLLGILLVKQGSSAPTVECPFRVVEKTMMLSIAGLSPFGLIYFLLRPVKVELSVLVSQSTIPPLS